MANNETYNYAISTMHTLASSLERTEKSGLLWKQMHRKHQSFHL